MLALEQLITPSVNYLASNGAKDIWELDITELSPDFLDEIPAIFVENPAELNNVHENGVVRAWLLHSCAIEDKESGKTTYSSCSIDLYGEQRHECVHVRDREIEVVL